MPWDKSTQYFYDPVGNLLKVIDRDGNPTTYTYDAINRRITITDAQPATTTLPVRPGRQSDSRSPMPMATPRPLPMTR